MALTRFLTLPGHLSLVNPATDEPAVDDKGARVTIPHANLVRTLMADPQIRSTMDVCDAYELRRKLSKPSGTVVDLTEEEHTALLPVVRRPATSTTQGASQFLTDAALCSPDVIAFFKSIINASTE